MNGELCSRVTQHTTHLETHLVSDVSNVVEDTSFLHQEQKTKAALYEQNLPIEFSRTQLRHNSSPWSIKRRINTQRINISIVKTPGKEREIRKGGAVCISQRANAIPLPPSSSVEDEKPFPERPSTARATSEDTQFAQQTWPSDRRHGSQLPSPEAPPNTCQTPEPQLFLKCQY